MRGYGGGRKVGEGRKGREDGERGGRREKGEGEVGGPQEFEFLSIEQETRPKKAISNKRV